MSTYFSVWRKLLSIGVFEVLGIIGREGHEV